MTCENTQQHRKPQVADRGPYSVRAGKCYASRRAAAVLTRTRQDAVVAAAALQSVAETFAGVPDGRHTAHTLWILAHMLDSG